METKTRKTRTQVQVEQVLQRYPLKRIHFEKIQNIGLNEVRIPSCCFCEEKPWTIRTEESDELPMCRKHHLLYILKDSLSEKGIVSFDKHIQELLSELKELGLDTELIPKCCCCDVSLNDENWTPFTKELGYMICKNCYNKRQLKWRKNREGI